MPFYSCSFRSLTVQSDALEQAETETRDTSSLLLLSRLIRESTANWLSTHLKPIYLSIKEQEKQLPVGQKAQVESWKLMPHLRLAFSLMVEMLAATELADEPVQNLVIIDHALSQYWTCLQALDNPIEKDKAIFLNGWVHDMVMILREKDLNQFSVRVCSPILWFLWGQSLVKISRNYLVPSTKHSKNSTTYQHHQALYLHCLDMAATKCEKCLRLMSQNHLLTSTLNVQRGSRAPTRNNEPGLEELTKLVAECHAAFGYIGLSRARGLEDAAVREWYFTEAASHLTRSLRVKAGSNCVYNLSCLAALQNQPSKCKDWLLAAAHHNMLPPLINVYHDPDLDSVREYPWFADFLTQVPSEKPSSDHDWMFSKYISISLLQSTFAMPEPTLNMKTDGPRKLLHLPKPRDSLYDNTIQQTRPSSSSSPNNTTTAQTMAQKEQFGDLSESIVFDEELNKLQASLQRDGFSKSTIVGMLKEVSKQKKADNAQNEKFEQAHARLMLRLTAAGMKQKSVIPGDGNCQFHSISDQLFDSIEQSPWVRSKIVAWLRSHGDWILPENGAQLKDFAVDEWGSYCDYMSKNGIWGDHLTLTAAAELFGVRIVLFSSVDDDNYVTEYLPTVVTSPKILFLCHYAEYHYGSVCRDTAGSSSEEPVTPEHI